MPDAELSSDAYFKQTFEEIRRKCAALGITVSFEEYQRNPQKYTNIAHKYNHSVLIYLSLNRQRHMELYNNLKDSGKYSFEEAFQLSRNILEQEAYEKILKKDFWVDKGIAHIHQEAPKFEPIQHIDKVLGEIYKWSSPVKGKMFHQIEASELTKSKNLNYFYSLLRWLNLTSADKKMFRKLFKNYNGTVADFLKDYKEILIKEQQKFGNNLSKPQAAQLIFKLSDGSLKKSISVFYNKKKNQFSRFSFKMSRESFLYRMKALKKDISLKNISFHFMQRVQKISSHFSYLKQNRVVKSVAIGAPLLGLSYLGIHHIPKAVSSPMRQPVYYSLQNYPIDTLTMKRAQRNFLKINNQMPFYFDYSNDSDCIGYSWSVASNINDIPIAQQPILLPKIERDQLYQSPNIDFFNYCFKLSGHDKLKNYGIQASLYRDFIKENKALSNMYRIHSPDKLNFTQARVIAKAQLFDKYSIGYLQNQRIAAFLYYVLANDSENNEKKAFLAQAVSDFYQKDDSLSLSPKQQFSLNRLCHKHGDIYDWNVMLAVINTLKTNSVAEKEMFAMMQNYVQDKNDTPKPTFAYAPALLDTLQTFKAVVNAPGEMMKQYEDKLRQQKEQDLEIFSKIYMQCCYDNYVKLEYGVKNQTFREADQSLRKYGLSHLSRGYYCAGMSVASLCQAVDIFNEQNPNSHVCRALNQMLDNFRNVHLCNTLKDDLNRMTGMVTYSHNLEKDIKNYMQKNKNAIVFGWAPRGHGRFHHQTFFQASETASHDVYTYCAFNRQHWGNEHTFANYMRSRSAHGKSGYFEDISAGIDALAERFLREDTERYYDEAVKIIAQQNLQKKDLFLTMAWHKNASDRFAG